MDCDAGDIISFEFADVEKCIPIITGGEPLLRRDILDIIDFAMAKLNNVVVVTNSLLLTDELIAELASRENLMIQVSLDGARRETHEYIRGKGTYDRAITSNIDSDTEERILKRVKSVYPDMTIIIVSHRLSTVRKADRIIVLDKSQVAENGEYAQLLDNGTVFRKIFANQI